jgi:hypothetical protein
VTDQGSLLILSPSSSSCGPIDATPTDIPPRPGNICLPHWPEKRPGVWLCCRVCGQTGRFVDPFPPIPRRRGLLR